MEFFTYHMPPFLTVMGALYILVALLILINLIRDGYWNGVFTEIRQLLLRNWLRCIISIVLILACIFWFDLAFTRFLKYLDTVTHSYTFWDFICSCAEGGLLCGVLFTLFMLADYFKLNKFAIISKISLMSSIYGGLANGVLKFLFNRQRPAIGLDQWHFFAFFESGARHFNDLMYAYNSMPSGHTISTVAAVVPFYLAYRKWWVRGLLIWWVLMVAFSRVYTINHWLSDVILAGLLGIVIGLSVFRVNQRRIDL